MATVDVTATGVVGVAAAGLSHRYDHSTLIGFTLEKISKENMGCLHAFALIG